MTQPPIVVYLGNWAAVHTAPDPAGGPGHREPMPGHRCTTVVVAPGLTLLEAAHDITNPRGVWNAHSAAATPAWVASTDPDLAQVLATHWGCELRDPQLGEN